MVCWHESQMGLTSRSDAMCFPDSSCPLLTSFTHLQDIFPLPLETFEFETSDVLVHS